MKVTCTVTVLFGVILVLGLMENGLAAPATPPSSNKGPYNFKDPKGLAEYMQDVEDYYRDKPPLPRFKRDAFDEYKSIEMDVDTELEDDSDQTNEKEPEVESTTDSSNSNSNEVEDNVPYAGILQLSPVLSDIIAEIDSPTTSAPPDKDYEGFPINFILSFSNAFRPLLNEDDSPYAKK